MKTNEIIGNTSDPFDVTPKNTHLVDLPLTSAQTPPQAPQPTSIPEGLFIPSTPLTPLTTEERQALAIKERKILRNLTVVWHDWKRDGCELIGQYLEREPVRGRGTLPSYYHYVFDCLGTKTRFALSPIFDKQIGDELITGHWYYIEYQEQRRLEGGKSIHIFRAEEIAALSD